MKKLILGSVMAVAAAASMNAQAATVCGGGGAGTVSVAAGTYFIKTGFAARCSANTHVAYVADQVNYTQVGGASAKGKTRFAGGSAGGGVTGEGCASATGCVASDATTVMTSAPSS